MSFENNVLRIKSEFLNSLRSLRRDNKSNQKEIIRSTHYYILSKVFAEMQSKAEIKKEHWEIFSKIISFCLGYGFAIIETLSEFKDIDSEIVSEDVEA